jgi:ABC-type arginine transport system ATPase subunit
VNDTVLRDILASVDLLSLFELHGWDDITDWPDMLSIGQQQRIGFARLFYHQVCHAHYQTPIHDCLDVDPCYVACLWPIIAIICING